MCVCLVSIYNMYMYVFFKGKSDVLISNEDSCDDHMPSIVSSMSKSVKKSQEDTQDDLVKINSGGISGTAEAEITSDSVSAVPIKPGIDVNKVDLHNKVNDVVKDCSNSETSVMKEPEIHITKEICIQTDIQNDYGSRNVGTQINTNDSTDKLYESTTKDQGNLSLDNKHNKTICSSSNNQLDEDYNYSNRPCENINAARIEKSTQTETEYSHALLQSVVCDSVETVVDHHTENAVILKTRGKSPNIQFVVNIPNETGSRQSTYSSQFISKGNNTSDSNLATAGINVEGPSLLDFPNVSGTQKSELIKDVIKSTVDQVLEKYKEPTLRTHLLQNESEHTENKTVKSTDQDLYTNVGLTVPNVRLETNTEFWTKLREATEFFKNVTSRYTETSLDNQTIHSDNKTDNKTGPCDSKFETKETVGRNSSQKPECASKTDGIKKQHYNMETKSIMNLTNPKEDSTLSSANSVASTSSSYSSCSVLKTRKYYRTNKNSSSIPVSIYKRLCLRYYNFIIIMMCINKFNNIIN